MLGILSALLSPLNFYAADVSEGLRCLALGARAPVPAPLWADSI